MTGRTQRQQATAVRLRWIAGPLVVLLVVFTAVLVLPITRPVSAKMGPYSLGGVYGDDELLTAVPPIRGASLSLIAASMAMPGMHFTRPNLIQRSDAWWWTFRVGKLRWAVVRTL